MGDIIKRIQSVVGEKELIALGIGVLIFILSIVILMMIKNKKVKSKLADAEAKYNKLKGIPLSFKLNKAVALSRINQVVAQKVEHCKQDFDNVQEELKMCSTLLADADDYAYVGKSKAADKILNELIIRLDNCDKDVMVLSDLLDEILEKENEQREQINELKANFREIKKRFNSNRLQLNQSVEYLDKTILAIEKKFSSFEEWMFASEFDKAAKQQVEIAGDLKELEMLLKELPPLYERAKGVLPRMIDEVGYHFAQLNNKGMFLEHLEVKRNLEVVSDILQDNLNKLKNGSVESVNERLNEGEKRLQQLEEQLSKEEKAFENIVESAPALYDTIDALNKNIENIEQLYERVCRRFGFENWNDNLCAMKQKQEEVNTRKNALDKIIGEATIPFTTIAISYRELDEDVCELVDDVNEMKDKLEHACADEERANKQLIKLQLIVNEIRVKMNKHRLPSVSLKYDEDLKKANAHIKEIKCLLNATPLDVATLNIKIKEGIDYIYTLYNSVNNLVGMAIMVENTIVFGNKYRSTYPDVDSELTRAELCFRNGQYTKALKIAIAAIEKLHPGSYENLIKEKTEEFA